MEAETRLQRESAFCNRLAGTDISVRERVQRAGEAGQWARATSSGRIPKPRPTSSINMRSQVYVVLRAPGLAQPVVCYSAAEYYQVLPHFTPESVSHSSLQQGKPESIALQPEWISQQDHDRDGIFPKWSDIPVRGQDIGSRPFVSVCAASPRVRGRRHEVREPGGFCSSHFLQERWTSFCSSPQGTVPDSLVSSDLLLAVDELLGPCTQVSVGLAAEGEDGQEVPLDLETPCIWADFHVSVLQRLKPYDPVTDGSGILHFSREDIDVVPLSHHLQELALKWIETISSER